MMKHSLEVLTETFGPPKRPFASVFPLSPSAITMDVLATRYNGGGCGLVRIYKSCYGWGWKTPEPMAAGKMFDILSGRLLTAISNMDDPQDCEGVVASIKPLFDELVKGFDLVAFKQTTQGFLEEIEGYIRAFYPIIIRYRPISTQQEHKIKYEARIDGEIKTFEARGFSDMIELTPSGHSAVRDIKLLAPGSKQTSKSRTYSFQLNTYAGGMIDAGEQVSCTSIEQFIKREFQADSVQWFLSEREVEACRQVYGRIHEYLHWCISGAIDFMRPYRGTGACTPYSCPFWDGCPFGNGRTENASKYIQDLWRGPVTNEEDDF